MFLCVQRKLVYTDLEQTHINQTSTNLFLTKLKRKIPEVIPNFILNRKKKSQIYSRPTFKFPWCPFTRPNVHMITKQCKSPSTNAEHEYTVSLGNNCVKKSTKLVIQIKQVVKLNYFSVCLPHRWFEKCFLFQV